MWEVCLKMNKIILEENILDIDKWKFLLSKKEFYRCRHGIDSHTFVFDLTTTGGLYVEINVRPLTEPHSNELTFSIYKIFKFTHWWWGEQTQYTLLHKEQFLCPCLTLSEWGSIPKNVLGLFLEIIFRGGLRYYQWC